MMTRETGWDLSGGSGAGHPGFVFYLAPPHPSLLPSQPARLKDYLLRNADVCSREPRFSFIPHLKNLLHVGVVGINQFVKNERSHRWRIS